MTATATPRPEDLVARIARHTGDRVALVDGVTGAPLSFAAALSRARTRAAELERHGVQRGETVAVPGVLSDGVVIEVLACWLRGCAVMPTEPAAPEWETGRRIESARVGWVIAEPGATPRPVPGRDLLPRSPGDRALCITTSGSSGPPKTVALTAANLAAASDQMAQRLRTGPDERVLSVLPIFHSAGFVLQLTSSLLQGWTQVGLSRFDAAAAWDLVDAHEITHTHVAPRMLELLTAARRAPGHDGFRFVSCGAAPLAAGSARAFEALTGVPVLRGYGMSETGATAHHVAPGENDGTDVGRAVAGARTIVVGPDGAPVPTGEVGEILLRGPQVALRYLDGTGSEDGWLHTGDLGSLDDTGRLTIAGRAKEVVKYNGHQVFPFELEQIVRTHPAVADAVVVGRPDPSAGEIPVARVVLRTPVTEQELIDFVATRVAPYRRARAIEVVDAIDRGAMGKARKT